MRVSIVRHAASLRETIGEVLDYIKSQVKLRQCDQLDQLAARTL